MLKIKPGVDLCGLKAEMTPVLIAANEAFTPAYCMVTSCTEARHGRGSKHYSGFALDFRTRHIPSERAREIRMELSVNLGRQYDVILEGDHIHVEYDPKVET